jgi:hypothetical protein
MDFLTNNLIIQETINNPNNINLLANYQHNIIEIKQTKPYQKTLLFRNEHFDVYQINWTKNSETPIHCHPKNGCLLKVVSGVLEETKYNNKEEIVSIYNKNDISYIDDNLGKHKIKALEDSISIHIYSPPMFYD